MTTREKVLHLWRHNRSQSSKGLSNFSIDQRLVTFIFCRLVFPIKFLLNYYWILFKVFFIVTKIKLEGKRGSFLYTLTFYHREIYKLACLNSIKIIYLACDQQVTTCQTTTLSHGRFEPETVEEGNYARIVCDRGYSNEIPYRKCLGNQLVPSEDATSFNCYKGQAFF